MLRREEIQVNALFHALFHAFLASKDVLHISGLTAHSENWRWR